MTDPSQMRISDAERHQVAEVLRAAAGEGRIDLDELDERLEGAYAAKVYADLVPLLDDLPGAAPAAGLPALVVPGDPVVFAAHDDPARPARRHESSWAVLGGVDRKGVWEVGGTHTAVAIMGGVTLDLREARFASREVVVRAYALMGGVDITVNAWTRVEVAGVGIMGGFDQARDRVAPDLDPTSPLLRVTGLALMGGVTVTRKPMPGTKRRKRLG